MIQGKNRSIRNIFARFDWHYFRCRAWSMQNDNNDMTYRTKDESNHVHEFYEQCKIHNVKLQSTPILTYF